MKNYISSLKIVILFLSKLQQKLNRVLQIMTFKSKHLRKIHHRVCVWAESKPVIYSPNREARKCKLLYSGRTKMFTIDWVVPSIVLVEIFSVDKILLSSISNVATTLSDSVHCVLLTAYNHLTPQNSARDAKPLRLEATMQIDR